MKQRPRSPAVSLRAQEVGPFGRPSPYPLSVEIGRRSAGGVTVLSLSGEFDALSMHAVREAVDEILREGCTRLVMNLSGLRFLNSPAITFLIQTAKELGGAGGTLVLSEPSAFLQEKMETLGLERVFKILPNDDAAVTYLNG